MDFSLVQARPGFTLVLLPHAPQFPIAAASNDLCTLVGKAEKELLGKSCIEAGIFHPDNRQLQQELEEIMNGKPPAILRLSLTGSRQVEVRHTLVGKDAGVHYILQTWEMADSPEKGGTHMEKAYHFFMNAPVIIGFLKGDEYVIELANEGLLEVWGRSAAVVGQPLLKAIPELEGQGFRQLLDEVRHTGKPFTAHEFPINLHRFGKDEVIYFDFIYKPYYENESDAVASGVIAVGHDVSAQVLAKQKVVASQEEVDKQQRLYEAINDNTPDLIYVFGLDYRFSYANKALLEMWGKTKETAIGRNLLENGYEPWHAAMHEREIDTVVATQKPVRGEVSFPHAMLGRRIYDYILVPVVNDAGEVEAVAGTTRDITDLKRAEQELRESNDRFRNLADESPIFVFLIDPEPGAPVSYWNKAWLEYTGQSPEDAFGRSWEGIIHPDDVQTVMDCYLPAFEKRAPYFIPAARVRRHDGIYRWHAFKGNPRTLPSGAFNGYAGVGFDIHDQKMAAEALQQSEVMLQQKIRERTALLERTVEELKRSNANLEEFAYAASHDLKEPIRKVHFFSDRIRHSLGARMQPGELQYFQRMESAAARMNTLIDDLLTYSQISLRPRVFEAVSLEGILGLVLEDLDMEIEEKKAIVKVGPMGTVSGHHRQLQQAFLNLIGNALKYSKPGVPPLVQISSARVRGKDSGLQLPESEWENDFYLVEIRDNGIGFEQSDAERIFNVFTRLHGNTEYRGSGIGLSIVRKVVEHHHGHIDAVSVPGDGTTFRMLLPVEQPGLR